MKYLLLISLLLLISCKKERNFHVSAKNAATGEPYPGLSYEIQRSWSGAFENKYKSVGSGVLDANGEAFFTKRLHDNSSYSISVAPPPNTCYISDSDLHAGGDKNFDAAFEFAECAYLKLSIHNINCIDANDQLDYRRLGLTINETNNFVQIDGCFQYEGEYFALPMGEYKYEWIVTKGGAVNNYDTTFYLSKNQNFEFNLNY